MTQEKGLDPSVADKIGQYVKLKGAGLEGEHQSLAPAHPVTISRLFRDTKTVGKTPTGFHPYVEQECEGRFVRHGHPFHPLTILWYPRQGMLGHESAPWLTVFGADLVRHVSRSWT
jgi:hypothetical protein